MPQILNLPATAVAGGMIAQTVTTRTAWADSWESQPNLHCEQVTFAVAPGISTASFFWRYGRGLSWASGAWQDVGKLSLPLRSYVKLGIQQGSIAKTWYGIWRSESTSDFGQRLTADGLEALLAWVTVRDSVYYDRFGAVRRAGAGLTFNKAGRPNRSLNTQPIDGQNAHVFDTKESRAQYWSTRDCVAYLLAAHAPTNAAGSKLFEWVTKNADALPDYDRPELATHGKTTLELLHALMDRRRLLSFYVDAVELFSPSRTAARLNVFTFTDTPIVVTAGGSTIGTIPANADTWEIRARHAPSADNAISINASHVADSVRVTGGRRQSVFSVNIRDLSLKPGWEDSDRRAYEAGASDAGDYPAATELRERQERDRQVRQRDDLAHVYQRFVLPPEWTQKTGDGLGDASVRNPIAITDAGAAYRIAETELTLLRKLPLLRGYNYADDTIGNNAGIDGHRGDLVGPGPYDPREAFCLARRPDYVTTSEDAHFEYVDRIGLGAASEFVDLLTASALALAPVAAAVLKPVDREWSARVQIADDGAIWLHLRGRPPHVLAKDGYNPRRDGAAYLADKIPGAWDYRDLVFTVAADEARRTEVVYPEPSNPVGEFVNELVISAGEQYRAIYVVPKTVVDVDPDTAELVRSNGGYVQDDRPQLEALARRAFEWYSVRRYALRFSTGYLAAAMWQGAVVTKWFDATGNLEPQSIVSEITVEFPRGDSAARISYATDFAELDIGSIFQGAT